MPDVAEDIGPQGPIQFPRDPADSPTVADTWSAAFGLENDVVNGIALLSKPKFPVAAPGTYNVVEHLRSLDGAGGTPGFLDNYRENFVGSVSPSETTYIAQQIMTELQRRQTMDQSGWSGTVAGVAAGMLSPTFFIPLVGPATKARSAWQFAREAAMLSAAGGVAQETVLQANQQLRPLSESALGVASQTVLGGLLGGAIGSLTAKELAHTIRALDDTHMSVAPDITPAAVGADVNQFSDPGRLASGGQTVTAIIDSNPVTRNPVTYNIEQRSGIESRVARTATLQLEDGGFRLEGNEKGIATSEGGTLQNRVQTYYNVFPDIIRDLDKNFMNYRYGDSAPTMAGIRTALGDMFGQTGGKLSKTDFLAEVSKALRAGDEHAIPEVAATAKNIRSQMFDPLLKEMQANGVLGTDIDLKGDLGWLFRDYNREAIRQDTAGFINTLAAHFEQRMTDEFAQELEKLKVKQGEARQFLGDLHLDPASIEQLKDNLGFTLKGLKAEAEGEHFTALQTTISDLRSRARDLRKTGSVVDAEQAKQMLADAKALERGAEGYTENRVAQAKIKRRLSNLNKAIVVLEERHARKLTRATELEEASLDALERVGNAANRFLREMDRWSDARLDEEIRKLKNTFADLGEQYDKRVERLNKLQDDPDIGKLIDQSEKIDETEMKMTKVAEALGQTEEMDRELIRSAVEAAYENARRRVLKTNDRRAVRAEQMRKSAAQIDEPSVKARVRQAEARIADRDANFVDRWKIKGADDIDLDGAGASFRELAKQNARDAKDRIMGTFMRLPSLDIIQGARGSEIARTLDVPSAIIERFLENNVEKLMRTTLRTVAPDIEMARRFGSVAGEDIFVRLADERNEMLENIPMRFADRLRRSKDPEATTKKISEEINQEFDRYKKNMEALIGRLRHSYGVPDDPEGLSARVGKTMMNLNVLRLMGGVVISSIPDVARPIMRYGLTRTFRDAVIPLITDLKTMQGQLGDVKRLAGGLDVVLQSRAAALFDILDETGRGTKFERGVEYATHRMGIVAGFDYWTSIMKQFTGAIAIRQLVEAVETVAGGTAKMNSQKAVTYLAENGIDGRSAQLIWSELTKAGGGDIVDGRWWPNTEGWNPETQRIFSSALVREVNNTIVTPGLDKPLWVDKSLGGRLVAQFKSYAMAATGRVFIAGLQQRDAAVVQGVVASLGLGMLSYYLASMAAGGDRKSEMLNADIDKWVDEAINRSGLLGVFSTVQEIAQRIPYVQPYASFSGTRSTRLSGDDLVDQIAGPSFDLVSRSANVVSGLGNPTDGTIHSARTVVPWQNVFYLRWLFDAAEDKVRGN